MRLLAWIAAALLALGAASPAMAAPRTLSRETLVPVLPPEPCEALVGREVEFALTLPEDLSFAVGENPKQAAFAVFAGVQAHPAVEGLMGLALPDVDIQGYVKQLVVPPPKELDDFASWDQAFGIPKFATNIDQATANLKIRDAAACSRAEPIELVYRLVDGDDRVAGSVRFLLFLRDTQTYRTALAAAKTRSQEVFGELAGADVGYFMSREQAWMLDGPAQFLCPSCSKEEESALRERLIKFLLSVEPAKLKPRAAYQATMAEWADQPTLYKFTQVKDVFGSPLNDQQAVKRLDAIAQALCKKAGGPFFPPGNLDMLKDPNFQFCDGPVSKKTKWPKQPAPASTWKIELTFANGASISFKALSAVGRAYSGIRVDPDSIKPGVAQ